MKTAAVKKLFAAVLPAALAASFWYSRAWLQLCYGLALFLFGMQCIEDGLRNAAGGTLERLMGRCTATPLKGMLFGVGATFVLQSTTLVSLLAIAFLGSGMITLGGGIAVVLGTNLGATGGIWLLALAGQNVSLGAAAVPMLVFGILAGFFGGRLKPAGRILVGIALIFLGIDAVKSGFQDVGAQFDFAAMHVGGASGVALFVLVGLVLTLVLQSSHATLILTLAALAGGQLGMAQAFAVAVGSNVGSSASTALVGMLGANRNGQRLALAHLLFNSITALLSLALWLPLTRAVAHTGLPPLLQLALFHTLFNLLGLAAFWPMQTRLAGLLQKLLPDKPGGSELPDGREAVSARYLHSNMLHTADTALSAVAQETHHLGALCLEVLCHVLFVPADELYRDQPSDPLPPPDPPLDLDAQSLYEWQIKPLYSEILDFTGKIDAAGSDATQARLAAAHINAVRMVETVKEGKHLQKNLQHYLQQPESPAHRYYLRLRSHLFETVYLFRRARPQAEAAPDPEGTDALAAHSAGLDGIRARVLAELRSGSLSGWQASSLMNDIGYARRIGEDFRDILAAAQAEAPAAAVSGEPEKTAKDGQEA